jgi:bacteriocin-like protein
MSVEPSVAAPTEKDMSKTNDTSYDAVAKSERELNEAELNQVSGGTDQNKFPTETIKFTYGSIEWTYTK